MRIPCLVMVLAAAQLGCATMLAPRIIPMPVSSVPSEAEVIIDGIPRGKTPLTLELDPRRSYTIVFKKAGLDDKVYELRSQVDNTWVVIGVILGGFPAIIDAGTGAWGTFTEKSVQVAWANQAPAPPAASVGSASPVAPGDPAAPAVPTPTEQQPRQRCKVEGTDAWKNASAAQKKRLLEECRKAEANTPPSS